ncbi:MAG: NAD-dependent epimerase/dehydratase family protein [Hydrotalea flava]|uniref:NAD-dependent epimerase/dehydratase family protein n=1 Tax=Hydrotalea TaxID=1004300 RepID=UPI0009427A5F|nr:MULTISPECIES: NAD-dependent epimerase/dehydratase family protein [Hydrotalea]MBY0349103.1 NAD-dependent epimerase/dehydratase family protein [Hydrotalea flava]RWZ87400.1 MAG: NAD-dependent epimerase/dehydratase family protein [Hydrotalea sp. AMD]
MILVTGGSGLLGTHLIEELLRRDFSVKAIYHNNMPPHLANKLEWVKCDILDVEALSAAMENVEQVYHCAGLVSFNPAKKKLLYKVNVEGTANVVNVCLEKNIKKLIHVSSVAALGRMREGRPVSERMKWSMATSNSEYGRTKYLGEMEVWRGIGEGLNAVILNPSMILGAGDWNTGSTELFKKVYHGYSWYTEGTSGFVDVKDVVRSMLICMRGTCNKERFIISSENKSYKEILTSIAHHFAVKPPHRKVTPFLAEIVWRIEAAKAFFTKQEPLITKETAKTALTKVTYDNLRFLTYAVNFEYTPIDAAIERICGELKAKYGL